MAIQHSHTERIARPVAHAFDVVVTHQVENHPRWEPECLEVRPLTSGPLGVGSRQVMVRHEYGRTREVENTCLEYDEGRRITWSHPDRQMDFVISFDFVAVDESSSDVTATV